MPEIFRVDLPNIMHEMIDNEVVVVNLDNGTYYSFDGVGAQIWRLLGGGGLGLGSLTAKVMAQYNGDRKHIAEATAAFVKRLCDEKLISAVSGEEENCADQGNAGKPATDFIDPVLQKYTDMEAMLLADPIHEVEEQGWPHLK